MNKAARLVHVFQIVFWKLIAKREAIVTAGNGVVGGWGEEMNIDDTDQSTHSCVPWHEMDKSPSIDSKFLSSNTAIVSLFFFFDHLEDNDVL